MDQELNEEELQDLFAWIDDIPLSRPKNHITRDFSDESLCWTSVMAAEVVKHFFPKLVDLHNYTPANSTEQKLSNWKLLNRKVFSKLDFHVPEETMKKIALSTAGVVVPVLSALREKIDKKLECTSTSTPDLKYYDIRSQEKPHGGMHEARLLAQLAKMKTDEKNRQKNSKEQDAVKFHSDMDPTFQLILKEKDEAIMSLMETVVILQTKVNKLEHLVHLKDMHIEDLTQHLEMYKARSNTH